MSKPLRRPKKIIVIRHAEKPTNEPCDFGVTSDGKRDSECLTIRGWQRAGALGLLFAPLNGSFRDPALAKPQHLFASKPRRRAGSRRPIDTISPLADKLGLTVNSKHPRDETDEMLEEAFACDGVVLICWQQEYIPRIASYILNSKRASPQDWPVDRFDMIWVFDRDNLTERYSFHQVAQCLLAGDSTSPIK